MFDLTINGTSHYSEDADLDVTAHIEDGDTCAHCGHAIAEYGEWLHDDTGNPWCGNLSEQEASEDAPVATPAPHAPGNWAGITIDDEGEAVQVQISVGDPRGCLTMTLRRVTNDEGESTLLLHVPHADDSTPHVALTPMHPGTFKVGA